MDRDCQVTIKEVKGATNTLSVSNLPSHNHTINAVVEDGNQSVPTNNLLAGTKVLDKEYSDASAANTQMNASKELKTIH